MNSYTKYPTTRINENGINEIETFISRALSPVKPRDEFIDELRHRLIHNDPEDLKRGNLIQVLIVIFVGLLGGLLIIIGAIKAFLSLIQAIKVLRRPSQIEPKIGGRVQP